MPNLRHLFFAALLVLLLSSCNKVRVVVHRAYHTEAHPHKVLVVDREDTIPLRDTTFIVVLSIGKHQLQVDNNPEETVEISDKGGMINIDNQEFVAFEILYGAKGYNDPNPNPAISPLIETEKMLHPQRRGPLSAVVIDSILVTPRGSVFDSDDDEELKKIVTALLAAKNGNLLWDEGEPATYSEPVPFYDSNQEVKGLKKFGKDELYIEKFWSYDVNETIPQSITTTKNRDTPFTQTEKKTAIMQAREFLILAVLNKDVYRTKAIKEIVKSEP
jgi:hypothetical protein